MFSSIIISYKINSSIYYSVIYMDNSAFKEKYHDSSCRTPQGNGSATYEEDADLPLYVSCCGYQNFITKDFSIQRPTGRLDYQILYIHKGCGHFFIDGEWQAMPAGSIVVYLPSEPRDLHLLCQRHAGNLLDPFFRYTKPGNIYKDITSTTVTSGDIVL